MQLDWRSQSNTLRTVTPAMAITWLQHHNKFNRFIKPSVVDQFVRDLVAGRWKLTHQGVAFDWNGQLVDGQHRLTAIAKANIAATVYVATGLDPLVREAVDIHSKRNVTDAFALSNRGARVAVKGMPANSAAGMWARMMYGIQQKKGQETRQEILAFSDAYAEGGEWALMEFAKHTRHRAVHVAPVMAAVARAYYHYADKYRLARCVEVLATGIPRHPDENAALHWRNVLTNGIARNSNRQPEIYGKTCRAIQAFMRNEVLTKFYEPNDEPFPLLPHYSDAAPTQLIDRMVGDRGELIGRGSGASGVAEGARH